MTLREIACGVGPTRVLVLSYWGPSAAYSGPARLLSRLFSEPTDELLVDLAYAADKSAVAERWPRQLHAVSSRGPRFGRWNQLTWILGTFNLLLRRRGQYHYLHFHGIRLANLLPAALATVLGYRVVIFPLVDRGEVSVDHRGPLAMLIRYVLRRAHLGFALSPGIAEELAHWGMPTDRIEEIGNPVDTARYVPATARDFPSGETLVGFVGTVGERKGAYLLAAAIAACPHELNVRGLFVGPPDAGDGAHTHPETLSVPGIRLTGYVHDPAELMRDMTMFVLPSNSEGLPAALAEAMSSGLPCVVTNVGGMATAVRSAACGVVVERTVESLRDAIVTLAADPDLRQKYGSCARAYALDHFSAEAVRDRYLKALVRDGAGLSVV